jgi:hypothetical protein
VKTTLLTWLWSQPGGRTTFTADHVNIWASMVRRNCSLDIDLACVTDMSEGIDPDIRIIDPPHEFEDVHLPSWTNGKPQCLRRLSMFRRDAADIFGERIVCMDLDCVIAGSIDHIVGVKDDFRICQGTAAGRPYNGSLLVLTAGCRPQAYEMFTPEAAQQASAEFLGSDQAWLAHALPGEKTFGLADGVMMSRGLRPKHGAIMFCPGELKPWDLVRNGGDPWVEQHYRSRPRGRAIYLGYNESVWRDAHKAMSRPYAAVFASPEAAGVWRGPIKAVVRDDDYAARVAAMHGYHLVVCGASERLAG